MLIYDRPTRKPPKTDHYKSWKRGCKESGKLIEPPLANLNHPNLRPYRSRCFFFSSESTRIIKHEVRNGEEIAAKVVGTKDTISEIFAKEKEFHFQPDIPSPPSSFHSRREKRCGLQSWLLSSRLPSRGLPFCAQGFAKVVSLFFVLYKIQIVSEVSN